MLTSKWLLGHAKPKRHRRKIWLIIIINGDQCHKLCCHMQKIAHTTHWTTIWVSLSFTLPPALVLSLFVSYSRISNRIMSHATLAPKSTNQILSNLPACPAACAAFKRCPICHPSLSLTLPLCLSLSLPVSHTACVNFVGIFAWLCPHGFENCCCDVSLLGSNLLLFSCLPRLQSIIDLINYPRTVCVS